jgi:hypothetical protein
MPETPTYSKAVRFDSNMERVRHFLQVDKPLAVSAGHSPINAHHSEPDFQFDSEEPQPHEPQFEWEISLPNFPEDTPERQSCPVRVERVFLSDDNQNLVVTVAVANLAFHKTVIARFTLDHWETTSEVLAEYNNNVRCKQGNDGNDRFNFSIKLADQMNLERKTLVFCIRYVVNGQEYWDNNNSTNYHIKFKKKPKPQSGKMGMSGFGPLPLLQSITAESLGRGLSLSAGIQAENSVSGEQSDLKSENVPKALQLMPHNVEMSSLQPTSYSELLDKYCFVRSCGWGNIVKLWRYANGHYSLGPPEGTPKTDGTLGSRQRDGTSN